MCLGRDIRSHPFVYFGGRNLSKRTLRTDPLTKYHFKTLTPKIILSLGIGVLAEPRWVNQRDPLCSEYAKCFLSCDACKNHGNAACSLFQSFPLCPLFFRAEGITAAGERIDNRTRLECGKLVYGVVELRGLSKLPWVVVPLPRHP